MKASSLSICVPLSYEKGRPKCNAKCPFCVSQMTMREEMLETPPNMHDMRNLGKAIDLAGKLGAISTLITGRGEPTLYPDHVSFALSLLQEKGMPLVDLQTNGLVFGTAWYKYENYLREWYETGLTTVALSIVHWRNEVNHGVYNPYASHYPDLHETVDKIHNSGLKVRLSVVMIKGGIDTPEAVFDIAEIAKSWGVEQLTVRPVAMPEVSVNSVTGTATRELLLTMEQKTAIASELEKYATRVMTLPHGAPVYDLNGQNICLSDCLTIKEDTDDLRQIIYENGGIFYDWRYPGARLL